LSIISLSFFGVFSSPAKHPICRQHSILAGKRGELKEAGPPDAGFYFAAMASISQRTPLGRSFTATQERAGLEVKYLA